MNGQLNLNTGISAVENISILQRHSGKKSIAESVFPLLRSQKTQLHTRVLFPVPVYLQFEYTVLMPNELIHSGPVSTWLHTLSPLIVKAHLHYSAIRFKLITVEGKSLYFNQRN